MVKMGTGISRLALLAALGGMVWSETARAQDDAAEDLGTITLTALRTAAEVVRSGVSVSVVDGTDLARAGSTRLSDYLAQLPGISVIDQGGFGGIGQVRVRGFDGRYIAVLVDGIRIDDPSGVQVQTNFGALMTGDIARVEVLRGSQSALWGGSAVAGVINISTLAEADDGLHQHVAVEAGSQNSRRLSYGLTQQDDRLSLSLNADHFRTDGVSAFDGGTETDGAEANRLSFAARYAVSDALTIGGAAFIQRSLNDFDGYVFVGSDYLFTDLPNHQTRTETGVRVFTEISAGNTLHELSFSGYRNRRALNDENGISHFTGERLALDWKATTEISPAVTLVYGIDWIREQATTTAQPGGSGDTDTTGMWGQVVWSPSETVDVTAALRHDDHSAFGGFDTGRLAVAWQPVDDLTLRGAIARGFRAPSLDELYGDYPPYFTGNPDLQPETSLSYELGADYALGNGETLSLTAFRIDIKDRIASDPATSWSTLGNLPGTSTSKGVELAARTALTDQMGLTLAYTYTDATDPNGARIVRVPRHNLTLTLDAALTDRLEARLTVQHLGGRLDNDVNSFSPIAMPDLTLIGAGFTYALTDSVQASLRIENLADRDYQSSHGYGTPGRSAYLGLEARF